jgi:hypothetical protein
VEKLTPEDRGAHPFNSALETGIRALVLLEAFHPRRCDLTELTWFDHLVVHTADVGDGSPSSLHPDLPNRAGELLVRRRLVEYSLRLMHQVHMVDIDDTEDGIVYSASEEAPSFLDLLQAPYTMELKRRADWLAMRFADLSSGEIKAVVQNRIGRWTAEFQAEHIRDASEAP